MAITRNSYSRAYCTCKKCGRMFEKRTAKRYGKDEEAWINWAKENIPLCDDCAAQERAKESAEAAELAKESGLPELTGTPKQVAWAESIRMAYKNDAEKFLMDLEARIGGIGYSIGVEKIEKEHVDLYTKLKNWVLAHDSSKFWIDNRQILGKPQYVVYDEFKGEVEG